jgi:hypothetical protein
VKTGAQFSVAFNGLQVMIMPALADAATTRQALEEKLDALQAEFAEMPEILDYIRDYWRPKLGAHASLSVCSSSCSSAQTGGRDFWQSALRSSARAFSKQACVALSCDVQLDLCRHVGAGAAN